MKQNQLASVVTGDIIGSSNLSPTRRSKLPSSLKAAYAKVRLPNTVQRGFEVFRGDSWQLYLSDPLWALQAAVALRAHLRADADTDTRAALVIDTVDFVDLGNVSEGDGAAFRRSGYALDGLRSRTLACLLPEGRTPSTRQLLFNTIASAAGAFASSWTPSQARAVALTLTLPGDGTYADQAEVAAAWSPKAISQPSVSKHLDKAHWSEIRDYLSSFTDETRRLIRDHASGLPEPLNS